MSVQTLRHFLSCTQAPPTLRTAKNSCCLTSPPWPHSSAVYPAGAPQLRGGLSSRPAGPPTHARTTQSDWPRIPKNTFPPECREFSRRAGPEDYDRNGARPPARGGILLRQPAADVFLGGLAQGAAGCRLHPVQPFFRAGDFEQGRRERG